MKFNRLHKSTFRRWREQNQRNGSPVGAAILDFLSNESEPHLLRGNFDPIPRVLMSPQDAQTSLAAGDDQQRHDDAE